MKPRSGKKTIGGRLYVSLADAAKRLGWTRAALTKRIGRAASTEGDVVLARIGGGIVAYRFGRTWRVVFPDVEAGGFS